jgi:hypothetical protein
MIFLALGGALARGQGCPPRYSQDFDGVTPPLLPANWIATQGMNVTGAPPWVTSTITPNTPPNDVFSTAPDNILDNRLDTPPIFAGIWDNTVTFSHSYDLEKGFDGAVLEISTPSINGGAFTDVTDPAVGGSFFGGTGYNSTISIASQSPIAGRMAWSGNSNGYVGVQLFLGFVGPSFHDNVVMRFRLATDNTGASGGWRVDTFRWHHNECATPTATATVASSVTPTPTGTLTPMPTSTPSATPTITPNPTATPTPIPSATPTTTPPPGPAQALNISTRLRVEAGDRIAIGGFIITGTEPKKVAIRGIGPSLGNSGLSGVLADPTMELRDYNGALLVQNDNWQDNAAHAAELTALGLALQNPNESGMVATLLPGSYTVLLAGKNQTEGLALVEIYDAERGAASKLANLSTRGFVRTGDSVMIGGFILGAGSADATVVVRGLGPSLRRFMLVDVLDDPMLELRDANGAILVANDNWQDDPISAAQLTGYDLQPTDALEPALFARLAPGAFTGILVGKNGDVGIALLELYAVPILVTSTADSGPGSLRDAIAGASDGDTIQFDPALNGQTIELTSGELVIDKSISIKGFQLFPLPVQRSPAAGTPAFRIFHITPGHTVTIQGLTISNGFPTGGVPDRWGGGIYNDGSTLSVAYCVISGNMTSGAGGDGGGIFNNANSSGHAALTISNSVVSGNSALGNSSGGGVFNNGAGPLHHATVELNDSTISGNSAAHGAGIYNNGFYSGDASLVVSDSTISGNAATNGGGGVSNEGTFTSGHASVTVNNSTISGNSARFGGAIMNNGEGGSGMMEISNSTISDNLAVEQGGGLYNTVFGATPGHSSGGLHADGSGSSAAVGIRNTILKTGLSGENIYNNLGQVNSAGYNVSSDNGGGYLTGTGDQINTNPMLGPLQDNGGPTFTHKLLSGSPAINAGDPNFTPPPSNDQRGLGYDRVEQTRLDVGSFEVQQ